MDPATLEKLFAQQLKLMEMLTQTHISSQVSSTPTIPQSVDGMTSSISEFLYDPDANITFDTWFMRYEDLFKVDFADKDDSWKVRLLLRKLGPSELDKYRNYILPQNPRDRSFDATVQSLSKLFGDQHSIFNTRYRCLKLVMNESDDFLTHVGIVNRECERFKHRSLTDDQFKSLIFICSLQSPKFSDIRTRLLNRLEQDPTLTLDAIADEYQRITNLQCDTTLVQSGSQGGYEVHVVQQQNKSSRSKTFGRSNASSDSNHSKSAHKKPPSPCWHCGDWHYVKFCPFKHHVCNRCQKIGHKSGFCQSTQFIFRRNSQSQRRYPRKPLAASRSLAAVFHTDASTRRKFLTLSINGQLVRMQLDTASDITILSEETWRTLGQPRIKPSSQIVVSACGGHLRLRGKLDCCVSFRDTTFNGTCYINKSPHNLLGLDWFEKLGLADLPINTVCNQVKTPAVTQQHAADFQKRLTEPLQPGIGLQPVAMPEENVISDNLCDITMHVKSQHKANWGDGENHDTINRKRYSRDSILSCKSSSVEVKLVNDKDIMKSLSNTKRPRDQLRPGGDKEKGKITKRLPLCLLLDTYQVPPIPPTDTIESSTQTEHPTAPGILSPRWSKRKRRKSSNFK
ncbi:unnamed protein product [Schistosoma turkestanicum]|nr:unnamed protein product [Schistosoma turkestanicum]